MKSWAGPGNEASISPYPTHYLDPNNPNSTHTTGSVVCLCWTEREISVGYLWPENISTDVSTECFIFQGISWLGSVFDDIVSSIATRECTSALKKPFGWKVGNWWFWWEKFPVGKHHGEIVWTSHNKPWSNKLTHRALFLCTYEPTKPLVCFPTWLVE